MNQNPLQNGVFRRSRADAVALDALLNEALNDRATPRQIQLSSDYYQSKKQIPTARELQALHLLTYAPVSPEQVRLYELYTNDAHVAETYADMMQKRRELTPNGNAPISLGEALRVASAYLARAGKSEELNGLSPVFCKAEDADENAACVHGSSTALALRRAPTSLSDGDVFILLHRGTTSHRRYDDTVGELLTRQEVKTAVKRYFTVPKEGLLSMLLPHFEGIRYDLRALAPDGYSATPIQLIGMLSGYRVLAVSEENASMICKQAAEAGIRSIKFATVTRGGHVEFIYGDEESVFFETAFLRELLAGGQATAALPTETVNGMGEISLELRNSKSCAYVKAPNLPQRMNTKIGADFSAAFAKIERAPFQTALQATLAALLSIAAAGDAFNEARLAIDLHCPPLGNDADRIGKAVAAILGIYRMQCELGIPAAIVAAETDDELNHPTLDVFAVSPKPTKPSILTQSGARLYCVAPAMTENGLPDFSALRALLKELAAWNEKGLIRSAKVLCNQRITDAVEEMETVALTFSLTDPNALAGDRIPLAILLEAEGELPYQKIGFVKARLHAAIPEELIALPSIPQALNRGERYEALVLAKKTDRAAYAFTKLLRSLGADCTLLDDSAEDWRLAKAMLTAQTVFLCGNVKLPDVEQLEFAQRVLHAAGGAIVRLGESGDLCDQTADLIFQNGIPMAVLKQIQSKTEKK